MEPPLCAVLAEHTGFLGGATDQNSDSHACTTSAFPSERSPVLTHLLAFKTFFSNVKAFAPTEKRLINTEVSCGLNVNNEVFCKSTSMKTAPRQMDSHPVRHLDLLQTPDPFVDRSEFI